MAGWLMSWTANPVAKGSIPRLALTRKEKNVNRLAASVLLRALHFFQVKKPSTTLMFQYKMSPGTFLDLNQSTTARITF